MCNGRYDDPHLAVHSRSMSGWSKFIIICNVVALAGICIDVKNDALRHSKVAVAGHPSVSKCMNKVAPALQLWHPLILILESYFVLTLI